MASLSPITGTLGISNAAHLLRRATFGPTKTEIENFATMTATEALNALLTPLAAPDPPIDPLTGSNWLPVPVEDVNSDDQQLFEYFKAWFMELMRTTGTNLRERMTFFLHSHLPADQSLIMNSTSLYYQNELYRRYATGNFKELFGKVCVDNAMLFYIDNTMNEYGSPNENFAREMLELYTIGKGDQIGPEDYTNYTETDVKQAARVLTGIKHDFDFETIDTDTGLPRGKVTLDGTRAVQHDPGVKTFTSKFGGTTIEPDPTMMEGGYATEEGFFDEIGQLMDMIFGQEETARFICRKLYRYFVYYNITDEIETDIIAPLATTFMNNDYELAPVLRQLLSSEHFYDQDPGSTTSTHHIGAIIKSPLDLVVGTLRFFKIDMPADVSDLYDVAYASILNSVDAQGMKYYIPIDVAGYPAYHQTAAYNRNWISPNWLATRYLFAQQVINGASDDMSNVVYNLDIVAYVSDSANISDPSSATTVVSELIDYMFTNPISTERYNYFLTIFLDGDLEADWTVQWNDYDSGTDDDTIHVRPKLELLLTALMQSPEYQLS